MRVRNIRWVGTATPNYDAMTAFVRQVLGLRLSFEEQTTAEFLTSDGDTFQVMAPGDPYYEFFTTYANGPVPLFEVDDVHEALSTLGLADIEIIGSLERDKEWQWIHFRAPDGNLYEMASRTGDSEPADGILSSTKVDNR
jgi:catechol 2,3-dioxygenase-like lactoylglutathione lyase family enzyme